MPVVDGEYVKIEKDEIHEAMQRRARDLFGNFIDLTRYSVFNSIFDVVSHVLAEYQEEALSTIYRSAFVSTASGRSLENVVDIIGISRRSAIEATGVVEFQRSTTATKDYVIQRGTLVQTEDDNPIVFETTRSAVLEEGEDDVEVNIRAVEGGADGNVGRGSIRVMPRPPTGIHGVTNLDPTGDDSYEDTDGDPLVVGQDEETDDELRDRATSVVTDGGDATHNAIVSELLQVPQVTSITVLENKTPETDDDGLPPLSFEAIVFGGSDSDVAEAIFKRKAVTSHDHAGTHGEEVTVRVESNMNGQRVPIHFSRPPKVDIELDLDLVVTNEYVGNEQIRDNIVEYVGGTNSSNNPVIGTGVGEDVLVDKIRNRVVGVDENGVRGVASIDSTPQIESNVDSLDAIVMDDQEVAETSAIDGSISISTASPSDGGGSGSVQPDTDT